MNTFGVAGWFLYLWVASSNITAAPQPSGFYATGPACEAALKNLMDNTNAVLNDLKKPGYKKVIVQGVCLPNGFQLPQ
jgi:hypothetical protein